MSLEPIRFTLPAVPRVSEATDGEAGPLAAELVALAGRLAAAVQADEHPFEVGVICEGIADTWDALEDALMRFWGYDLACKSWPVISEQWARHRAEELVGSAPPAKPEAPSEP